MTDDHLISLPEIPIIDVEILSNLDPEYAKVLKTLLTSLEATKDIYELRKIFDNFIKKYIALPKLWIYRKNLYSVYVLTTVCANRDEYEEINTRAYCDFYSADSYTQHGFTKYYENAAPLIYDRQIDLNYRKWTIGIPCIAKNHIYHDLCFPHEKIFKVFEFYEAVGDQFLPQNLYLKSKKTIESYEKFKIAKSIKDFFDVYIEIGDDAIAVQNIELLIDENPTCKSLWEAYLQFLKHRLPRVYLDVFHKYISFFISDTEMLTLFKQEYKRIHSTINITEHKSLEDLLLKKEALKNDYFSQWQNPPLQNFSNHFKTFVHQNFSLPSPILRYILCHGSAKNVNLLFQICKHLFLLKQTPICCNYVSHNRFKTCESPFYQQSIRTGNKVPFKAKKIFVAKTLKILCPKPCTLLSTLITKISRCTIWSFNVKGQMVSWNELKFLLESGNIERFVYVNGKITVTDGALISIENIVEAIPKAHTFFTDSAAFTPKTFSRLAVLEKPVKFKEFVIKNVTNEFKFKDFNDFIKNNSGPKSRFTIWFEIHTKTSFIKNSQNLLKALLNEWKPRKFRPYLSFRAVKRKNSSIE